MSDNFWEIYTSIVNHWNVMQSWNFTKLFPHDNSVKVYLNLLHGWKFLYKFLLNRNLFKLYLVTQKRFWRYHFFVHVSNYDSFSSHAPKLWCKYEVDIGGKLFASIYLLSKLKVTHTWIWMISLQFDSYKLLLREILYLAIWYNSVQVIRRTMLIRAMDSPNRCFSHLEIFTDLKVSIAAHRSISAFLKTVISGTLFTLVLLR